MIVTDRRVTIWSKFSQIWWLKQLFLAPRYQPWSNISERVLFRTVSFFTGVVLSRGCNVPVCCCLQLPIVRPHQTLRYITTLRLLCSSAEFCFLFAPSNISSSRFFALPRAEQSRQKLIVVWPASVRTTRKASWTEPSNNPQTGRSRADQHCCALF